MNVQLVGLGESAYEFRSAKSPLELARAAIKAAADDAQIDVRDIDAVYKFAPPFESVTMPDVARAMGLRRLSSYGEFPLGADAIPAAVLAASSALVERRARFAVIFRAIQQSKGRRLGRASGGEVGGAAVARGDSAFFWPQGIVAPSVIFGLMASRYCSVYDVPAETFTKGLAAVVLQMRENASKVPRALLRDQPLNFENYLESPYVAEPLRKADLCLENDGAAAVILSLDANDHSEKPPVRVLAASAGFTVGTEPFAFDKPHFESLFDHWHAQDLFGRVKVSPHEVKVAQLYDASTFMVVQMLEDFGYCKRGTGVHHLLEHGLGPEAALPVNTHGGNLAEAYIHGLNALIEAVRQVRGVAAVQVPNSDLAMFGAPCGGGILLGGS
jgi:acetyl-CoA acetyltransferase